MSAEIVERDLTPSPLDTHWGQIEAQVIQQATITTRQLRRWIFAEDVAQELRWWCQGHDAQLRGIWERTEGDEDARARVLHVALKRQAWKVITRLLRQFPPTHEAQVVLDQIAYSAAFIEERLDVIWDPDALVDRPQLMAAESAGRVRTTRSPTSVDDWRLWIIDLQEAFVRLPKRWQAILECLEHLGLSQTELAEHLGVTQSRISQIRTEAIRRMVRELSGSQRGPRQPLGSKPVAPVLSATGRVLQVPAGRVPHQRGDVLTRGADLFEVLQVAAGDGTSVSMVVRGLDEAESASFDEQSKALRAESARVDLAAARQSQLAALEAWSAARPDVVWENVDPA